MLAREVKIDETPRISPVGHAKCFAVKVRSRREAAVSIILRKKGFEVLAPTYIASRRYSDRVKKVECALFPGYVFVRLNHENLLPIVKTEGVSYIVRSGYSLRPLLNEEEAAIRTLCTTTMQAEPCDHFHVGQRVSIESGPLLGIAGVLVRVGEQDRLVISISTIFNSISVDVRGTMLKRIDP